MANIGPVRANIKSVILCTDRSFKHKAVKSLTSAAFRAEKFTVEQMREAIDYLTRETHALNFIFDATAYSPTDLQEKLELFKIRIKNPGVRILIYLEKKSQKDQSELISKIIPEAHVFFLPQMQSHYNQSFYGKSPVATKQEPKKILDPNEKLVLIETSLHIRETVDLINSVSKDRTRLDIVHQIGQKFSGISGTFGFFTAKSHFRQVRNLALVIDGIARAYGDSNDADAISDQHWELLRESAVTLYLILQELREEQSTTKGLLDSAASLLTDYQEDETIRKLNSHSQAEIDRIFSSLIEDDELKVS